MRHACLTLALGLALLGFAALAQGQTPSAGPPFAALDTDKSGRMTLDEVLAHAKKQGAGVAPFRISDADLDGDGRLSAEEQRKAGVQGLEGFGAVDLKELDVHGDGYVSREDLDEFFRRKHREAFARADADQDGALRPDEFVLYRF